ncbi:hypothetical protein ON010_g18099 [Phytophthora cinnamomi]|nr:hypothetical protein ON010_g18099 [Phytophthora cinnamomi]
MHLVAEAADCQFGVAADGRASRVSAAPGQFDKASPQASKTRRLAETSRSRLEPVRSKLVPQQQEQMKRMLTASTAGFGREPRSARPPESGPRP